MSDNVNIIVQDTINEIIVNSAITVETIDINVQVAVDEVTIIANPNEYIINVNRIIGEQVQSDWNVIDDEAPDYIKNKPTIPSIDGLATIIYVDQQDALKVDKITGKGLSTNDFTDTLKTKLDGIQEGAEVNVNADWNAVSGDAEILNKPTIPVQFTKTSDLINDGEDGINPFITSADIIPQVNSDWNATSGVAEILNKPIIPSIDGLATVIYVDQQDALKVDKVTGSRLITSAEATILSNTSGVNTGDQDLSGKVDKVAGYSLTKNDFTDTLKTKLDGIAAGAEVNVNADWNAVSGDAQILNKPSIPAAQIQSDWTQTNNVALDYIKNKPTIPTAVTKTSDLINDGDDGVSHFISLEDLPSNLTLYATNAASDVATYYKLVTSITDPSFNTTAVNIPTGAITTTNQFISSLITTPNVIAGNPGVFNITTIGNIQRLSGTGNAEFYFEVWKRVAAGTETLITTSNNTLPVLNSGYAEFSATALWNDGVFLSTDRIVLKYYASRVAGGSNPSYQFQFGGISPVRSLVPIPLNVVPVIKLDDLQDVTITSVANNEILTWETASNLWKNKTVVSALGFTPYNATNPNGYTSNLGTVTSVAALTLGTTGVDLSSTVANGTTTPVITLNVPTASATNRGVLSSTDWTTFNAKQNALTNPITGTGTTNYLPKFTGASALGNSLIYDNGTNVGIGTTAPSQKLDVNGKIKSNSSIFIDSIGSDSVGLGANFTVSRASDAKQWIMQLNGSAGLDFWNYNGTAFNRRMTINESGSVGIGTTAPTSKLDIVDTTLSGSGALAGSVLKLAQTWNTTGNPTAIFANITNTASGGSSKIMDLQIGTVSQLALFKDGRLQLNNGTINAVNNSLNLRSGLAGGAAYVIDVQSYNTLNGTNNEQGFGMFSGTYAPTTLSGVPSFNALKLSPTINQTGGANGITRGLYINPTLTSAANFRAVELSNNTGFGIFQSGTAVNSFAGNVGIGTTAPSFPLSLGMGLGNKIGLYDAASGTGYGFGIQANLLQVFANTSADDITFGYGNSTTLIRNVTFKGTGNVGIGTTAPTSKLQVVGLVEYATNALAITGGLTVGAFYHTTGVVKVVI